MDDAIGPGTPAWTQFENAIIAWRKQNKKSYYNHVQSMKNHLNKHGGNVREWMSFLIEHRDDPTYLEE